MTTAPRTRERVTESRLLTPTLTSWPVNQDRPRSPVKALVEPVPVLDQERTVQAQLAGLQGNLGIAGGGAHDAAGDVAAARIKHQVGDRGDDEQQEDTGKQAPQHESVHSKILKEGS